MGRLEDEDNKTKASGNRSAAEESCQTLLSTVMLPTMDADNVESI